MPKDKPHSAKISSKKAWISAQERLSAFSSYFTPSIPESFASGFVKLERAAVYESFAIRTGGVEGLLEGEKALGRVQRGRLRRAQRDTRQSRSGWSLVLQAKKQVQKGQGTKRSEQSAFPYGASAPDQKLLRSDTFPVTPVGSKNSIPVGLKIDLETVDICGDTCQVPWARHGLACHRRVDHSMGGARIVDLDRGHALEDVDSLPQAASISTIAQSRVTKEAISSHYAYQDSQPPTPLPRGDGDCRMLAME